MRRNVAKARKAAEHFATSFTLFHKVSSHSIRLASRFHEGGTLLAAGAEAARRGQWHRPRRRRAHLLKRLPFGLQIGLCVVVGRIEADVSQPTADDGDVDSGSDKVNGGRVPEAVRRHIFGPKRRHGF